MAPEPGNPAREAEPGDVPSGRQARAELRATLSRMPSEADFMWFFAAINLIWIAGLVAYRLLT